MRYHRRELEAAVLRAARSFPAVVLTGPRRSGKTSLLRHLLPRATYRLLEDPELIARLRSDPRGFLESCRPPVLLDEVQNVPEIFAHVRALIDRAPRKKGQWFLTGSQEAPLMQGVSESMAGRAAILHLLPLSVRESARVSLLHGGYPEVLSRRQDARSWFSSFVQTYLERDVRAVTGIRDLATFRRFLAVLASRHGQILNRSDLAGPLGVSVPTINAWLSVLEVTAQILIVPPFYENLGKRLLKSPKIYIADSGLACHLLGIDTPNELAKSPFRGSLFEGFVAAEIAKRQAHAGGRRELYFFRDEQGLEVDFVLPGRGGALELIECKAAKSVFPSDAQGLLRLAAAVRSKRGERAKLSMRVVHEAGRSSIDTNVLAPGVQAQTWREFLSAAPTRGARGKEL
jgi:predicted AAA+ superfamily ATPase